MENSMDKKKKIKPTKTKIYTPDVTFNHVPMFKEGLVKIIKNDNKIKDKNEK